MPSPVNRPLMNSSSSEPGTITETSIHAMIDDAIAVNRNRIKKSVKGVGSLLPSRSTPLRNLSLHLPSALVGASGLASPELSVAVAAVDPACPSGAGGPCMLSFSALIVVTFCT